MPEQYKCERCGKTFTSEGWFARHKKACDLEAANNPGSQPKPPTSTKRKPRLATRPKASPKPKFEATPAPALSKVIPDIIDLQRKLRERDDEISLLKRELEVQNLRVRNLKSALQATHTVVALGLNADVCHN